MAALVFHSGNDVAGGNRGSPTLSIYDYWNCIGAPALWCLWLPELLCADVQLRHIYAKVDRQTVRPPCLI